MNALPVRDDLKYYAKVAVRKLGPVAGQVEVTSECFQRCRGCDSWREDVTGVTKGIMSLETMQHLCLELGSYNTFEHLSLTGGDPQAWPHLTEFLHWFEQKHFNFSLQLNTALARPISEEECDLWRRTVRDVRVSLDAIDPKIYQQIRGDDTDPVAIINRMQDLRHPRMATNTTIFTLNLHQVKPILDMLATHVPSLRKAMFLAVIGERAFRDKAFWEAYDRLEHECATWTLPFEVSFANESVTGVREFLETPEAQQIPCYAGNITFHIKPDGAYYPCCLVGGEALPTARQYMIGNINQLTVKQIIERYGTPLHYKSEYCRKTCQYKQCALNVAAHAASSQILAMP